MRFGKRGDINRDIVLFWIIALAVLAIIVIASFVLFGKGSNAIQRIKEMFMFGR